MTKTETPGDGQGISWVAHRGYPARYPENTLIGYQAAIDAGARFVELDIQLTADSVPVLHHDLSLTRMAGIDEDIVDVHLADLMEYPACYPSRFGDRFMDNRFCSLEAFSEWFTAWPDALVFVEIKDESVRHFGAGLVVDSVYRALAPIHAQSVVISFNDRIVEKMHSRPLSGTGWVLPRWGSDVERRAAELSPDYLFSDIELLPADPEERWQGGWQWVIYNIDDIPTRDQMLTRGYRFLETNRIGEMIAGESVR